jgi:hypothetical protein
MGNIAWIILGPAAGLPGHQLRAGKSSLRTARR